jgi:23S rRNA pseudouridine1911/1915/1917 synthase
MSEQHLEFTVEDAGERLDKVILAQLEGHPLNNGDGFSRMQVQTFIKEGRVTVNGTPAKPGIKLRGGETVRLTLPESEQAAEVQPEQIDLTVIYEDDDLAVIDKPAGLVVHPAVGNESGTLVNAILARWPKISQMSDAEGRRGIVHRLDKDTSGLMVIALNDAAQANLMRQFQARTVEKIYLALLERAPKTLTGLAATHASASGWPCCAKASPLSPNSL